MYSLRLLSINDVVRAIKRRDVVLALRISGNLCSNAVNSVRFNVRQHVRRPFGHSSRRGS